MKDTFTVEEIRKYILSQDSLGDVMYNLSAENIIKANEIEFEDDISYDEIENYFHCDRCGANLNEACKCDEE